MIGAPTLAFAQQTSNSKSLANVIATMDALHRRCIPYFSFNTNRSLQIVDLAYKEGDNLFSKDYFSEVVIEEMGAVGRQIDDVGERAWCFETRGQMRQTLPDLFPADAPTQ